MKRFISLTITFIFIITLMYTCFAASASEEEVLSEDGPGMVESTIDEPTCKAQVIEIISIEDDKREYDDGFMPLKRVLMKVKVLSGPRKGAVLDAKQEIQPNDEIGKNDMQPCKAGDKITVFFSLDEYGRLLPGTMVNYVRTDNLMIIAVIFAVLLLYLCGSKGIKSVGALLVTCILVLFVMIPMIYDGGIYLPTFSGIQKFHIFSGGVDPTLASVVTAVFIIAITLVIVYGRTSKTLAAAIGAAGGVIVAGLLSAFMIWSLNMTGIVNEEAKSLVFTGNGKYLDISGILFASVLIGALGGTIDVGISIASSLEELSQKAKNIRSGELMTSGINIGSDIMGASLNTLILAYVGGSMEILILFYAYDMPFIDISNTEQISAELIRALAGSFGLMFTVPITSFVCALMMGKGGWNKDDFAFLSPVFIWKKFLNRFKKKEKVYENYNRKRTLKILKGKIHFQKVRRD